MKYRISTVGVKFRMLKPIDTSYEPPSRRLPKEIINDPIAWYVWERIKFKPLDFLCAFCGDRGSGKSTSALSMAELYDLPLHGGDTFFNIDRVVFYPSNFLELVKKRKPRSTKQSSFILWDETGLELSSKRWFSSQNFVISNTVQSMRFKRLAVLFTFPHFSLIDNQVRRLFQAYVENKKVLFQHRLSQAMFRIIEADAYTGEIALRRLEWAQAEEFKIYGRRFIFTLPLIRTYRVYDVFFQPPSQELYQLYEEKKEEAVKAWYERYTEELKQMESFILKSAGTKKEKLKEILQEVKSNLEKFLNVRGLVSADKVMIEYGISQSGARTIASLINDEIRAEKIKVKKQKGAGKKPEKKFKVKDTKKEKLKLPEKEFRYLFKKYGSLVKKEVEVEHDD